MAQNMGGMLNLFEAWSNAFSQDWLPNVESVLNNETKSARDVKDSVYVILSERDRLYAKVIVLDNLNMFLPLFSLFFFPPSLGIS